MGVTIKDIATRAGASRGTVDRVIHNRGNVAPYLQAHIENVITELGYKRNIIASQLVRNKTIKIATLLPHPAEDIYWTLPHLGIEEAVEEYKHLGVQTEHYYFNLAQAQSLEKAIDNIAWDEIDAVIMAPLFQTESINFFKNYAHHKKPLVFINTDMTQHIDHSFYVGQDSYQSGLLAGKLFDLTIADKSPILMIRIGRQFDDPEHYLKKEQGIRHYFSTHQKDISITNIRLHDYGNIDYMQQELADHLKDIKPPYNIFVPNSKASRLIQILSEETLAHTQLIGFDLITENISELQKGSIDFIINQNPKRQGFLAIKLLVNKLILDLDIPKKMYVPLDIIVKENLSQLV